MPSLTVANYGRRLRPRGGRAGRPTPRQPMKAEQAATLLARTSLFAGLDESELLALGACARRRTYQKGEHVFHQGDAGDAVFVLAEGRVKVIFASAEGDEMILATLQPPDVFGELALIDGGPRSA